MSRFYASIQGDRGEATRQGHKTINGHIRGCNRGVSVSGRYNEEKDEETFSISVTGGSNSPYSDQYIGYVSSKDGVFHPDGNTEYHALLQSLDEVTTQLESIFRASDRSYDGEAFLRAVDILKKYNKS